MIRLLFVIIVGLLLIAAGVILFFNNIVPYTLNLDIRDVLLCFGLVSVGIAFECIAWDARKDG